jgi:hypothetical protein
MRGPADHDTVLILLFFGGYLLLMTLIPIYAWSWFVGVTP